ncbi:MAG: DNA-directed RNA polymerase subunit omega [Candidatus Omnitrophica bacterium]|nr:DNA-directed RNA polymerase subunit omega [Candidatus Omnitrophota bacterium]
MAYLPLENLLDKSNGSVYKLVILAAKRALEIAEGQPKLVEASEAIKPSTVALMEISGHKIESRIKK